MTPKQIENLKNLAEAAQKYKETHDDYGDELHDFDMATTPSILLELIAHTEAQAARIKELEVERDALQSQLDDYTEMITAKLEALQCADELPELPAFWMYPQGEGFRIHLGKESPEGVQLCEGYYTADQLRQAQAMALAKERAKFVPLTDEQIRSAAEAVADELWPVNGSVGWTEDDTKFHRMFFERAQALAHGITGEPT